MKTVRQGTFETNSSSCHSLTITSEKQFNDFKKGNAILDIRSNELYSTKDFIKLLSERYTTNVDYKYWEYAEGAWEMYSNYTDTEVYVDDEDIEYFVNCQTDEIKEWYELNSNVFQDMIQHFNEDARKYENYDVQYAYDIETFEETKIIDGKSIVAFGYFGRS